MKRMLIAYVLVTAVAASWAQSAPREGYLRRIAAVQSTASAMSDGTPMMKVVISSIREKNRGISEATLEAIRNEAAGPVEAALRDFYFGWVKKAFAQVPDDDLHAIADLMDNPVFVKYQGALSSPESQADLAALAMRGGGLVLASVNEVLARRGLNQLR